jgi:hypothetical protein
MEKGDRIVMTCQLVETNAVILLASVNNNSLLIAFDTLVDDCMGLMPLFRDDRGYYNIVTGTRIGIRPA